MTEEKANWRTKLGITLDNPFARYAIILTSVSGIALVTLFFFIFAGDTAKTRLTAGWAFLVLGVIASIAAAFLFAYARNYARIQSILNGNYWAHWQYKKHRDVYISPLGIYYPHRRFILETFSHELLKVEIPEDSPGVIHFNYLYLHQTSPTMPVSRHEKKIVVPIPSGKEDEAMVLVERFQSQIGKPSVSAVDQFRIIWIMGFAIVIFVLLCAIFVLMPLDSAYRAEIQANRKAENDVLEKKNSP